MNNFVKGFMCAACITLFGKMMYEKGKNKDSNKEKRFGKFIITIEKTES